MSKFTTEVRFICETACGYDESKGYGSVNEIINGALNKVFDFDFPIFDEAYRSVLERKILKHYYTREIGEETVGLWKLRLDTKLNEIMPYYNKLYESELLTFNPLYTTNLTRTRNGSQNNSNSGTVESKSNNTSSGYGKGTSDRTSWDKFSDTPQGELNDVVEGKYLTEARLVTDGSNSESSSTNVGTNEGTVSSSGIANTVENYLENIVGYEGKDASKMLVEYRQTFLNIDMMVINALEDLFMQLW